MDPDQQNNPQSNNSASGQAPHPPNPQQPAPAANPNVQAPQPAAQVAPQAVAGNPQPMGTKPGGSSKLPKMILAVVLAVVVIFGALFVYTYFFSSAADDRDTASENDEASAFVVDFARDLVAANTGGYEDVCMKYAVGSDDICSEFSQLTPSIVDDSFGPIADWGTLPASGYERSANGAIQVTFESMQSSTSGGSGSTSDFKATFYVTKNDGEWKLIDRDAFLAP